MSLTTPQARSLVNRTLIIAPFALLCLGYSVGGAQSCCLTIPRTLVASPTRLAPALCTLDYISRSGVSPKYMHMCILLCSALSHHPAAIGLVQTPHQPHITSTHSHRARANTTSTPYIIAPTTTTYAPHDLHPGGRTIHVYCMYIPHMPCNVAPCAYNIHVHIHRDCAFHLHSHLGRNSPLSETRIMHHAAMPHARHSAPRCCVGRTLRLKFYF